MHKEAEKLFMEHFKFYQIDTVLSVSSNTHKFSKKSHLQSLRLISFRILEKSRCDDYFANKHISQHFFSSKHTNLKFQPSNNLFLFILLSLCKIENIKTALYKNSKMLSFCKSLKLQNVPIQLRNFDLILQEALLTYFFTLFHYGAKLHTCSYSRYEVIPGRNISLLQICRQ